MAGTTPIGGISVYLEDDTERFRSGYKNSANLVEQESARMAASLGRAAGAADKLNSTASRFDATAFRVLAIEALKAENGIKSLQSAAFALQAVFIGGVGALAAQRLVGYADTYTTISNKIKSVVSDQTLQASTQQRLFDLAQRTRGSYEVTATLYNRIASTSPQLANNQENLLRVIETVKKSFAVAGSTTAEANSVATQLSQALGSGRLQGDELRSILENNIPLAQALAKELSGGNVGALKQMGTEGLLTTEKVIDAILKGSADIDAAFARTTPRVSDGFQAIDNALIKFLGEADKSVGASANLAKGLVYIGDNLEKVGGAALYFGGALAAIFAGKLLSGGGRAISAPFFEARDAANQAVKEAETLRDAQAGKVIDAFGRTRTIQSAARTDPDLFADKQALAERKKISAEIAAAAKDEADARKRLEDVKAKASAIPAPAGASAAALESEGRAREKLTQAFAKQAEAETALIRVRANAAQSTELASAIAAAERARAQAFADQSIGDARSKLAEAQAFEKIVPGQAATSTRGPQMLAEAKKGTEKAAKELAKTIEDGAQLVARTTAEGERLITGTNRGTSRDIQLAESAVAATKTATDRRVAALNEATGRIASTASAADRKTFEERSKAMVAQSKAEGDAQAAVKRVSLANITNEANEQVIRESSQAASSVMVANSTRAQTRELENLSAANKKLASSQDAARFSTIAFNTVATAAKATFSAIYSALGGPIGIGLAGLSVAGIYLEIAAARAEEFRKALDAAALSAKALNDAIKNGSSTTAALADSQRTLATVQDGREEALSNLKNKLRQRLGFDQGDESSSRQSFGPAEQQIESFYDTVVKLGTASNSSISDVKELVKTLEDYVGKGPDNAKEGAGWLELARSILKAKEATAELTLAQDMASKSKNLDARDRRTNIADQINADVTVQGAALRTQADKTSQQQLQNAQYAGDLRRKVIAAEGDKTLATIQATEKQLTDAYNADEANAGNVAPVAAIREAANRIIMASTIDASKALENAVAAQVKFTDAVAAGSPKIAQFAQDIRNLQGATDIAIGTRLEQVGTALTDLRSKLSANGVDVSGLQKIQEELVNSQKQGTLTKEGLDTLIAKLQQLSGQSLDMTNVIAPLLNALGVTRELIGSLDVLRGKTSSGFAGGALKASDTASTETGDEKAERTKRALVDQQNLEIQNKIKIANMDKAGQKLSSLRDQYPDADPKLLKALADKEAESKAKGKKSDEEKFEERLARLKEEGRASFFSQTDRDLITEIKKIKGDPALLKSTNDAILAGTALPEKAQQIKQAIDLKKAGDEAKNITDKYATQGQETQKIAEYQERLNIAMKEYIDTGGKAGITSQQAALALADFKSKFGDLSYINSIPEAIGGFAEKAITDFKNIGSAAEALKNQILKIFVDIAVVDPLKNMLKGALSGAPGAGGGLGGLGGFLGSLFGGGAGSSATGGLYPGASAAAVKFHGGGMLLPDGGVDLWKNAPRYHEGLNAGEMRAVLMEGEAVLTGRQQQGMKALASSSGSAPVVQPVINVINAPKGTETSIDPNTGAVNVDIPLNQMENRTAQRAGRGQGPMGSLLRNQVPRNG